MLPGSWTVMVKDKQDSYTVRVLQGPEKIKGKVYTFNVPLRSIDANISSFCTLCEIESSQITIKGDERRVYRHKKKDVRQAYRKRPEKTSLPHEKL